MNGLAAPTKISRSRPTRTSHRDCTAWNWEASSTPSPAKAMPRPPGDDAGDGCAEERGQGQQDGSEGDLDFGGQSGQAVVEESMMPEENFLPRSAPKTLLMLSPTVLLKFLELSLKPLSTPLLMFSEIDWPTRFADPPDVLFRRLEDLVQLTAEFTRERFRIRVYLDESLAESHGPILRDMSAFPTA